MTHRFEKAFEENKRQIESYFLKRGCGEESNDLAQMTFIKAYRNLTGFRGDCPFNLWLLRIAKSLWQNHLRDCGAQKRKANLVPIDEDRDSKQLAVSFLLSTSNASHDPLTGMLVGEEMGRLREFMRLLPQKQRTVSYLHYFQERDFDEISSIMNLNRSTVKSHLSQAKKRLRQMWQEESLSKELK